MTNFVGTDYAGHDIISFLDIEFLPDSIACTSLLSRCELYRQLTHESRVSASRLFIPKVFDVMQAPILMEVFTPLSDALLRREAPKVLIQRIECEDLNLIESSRSGLSRTAESRIMIYKKSILGYGLSEPNSVPNIFGELDIYFFCFVGEYVFIRSYSGVIGCEPTRYAISRMYTVPRRNFNPAITCPDCEGRHRTLSCAFCGPSDGIRNVGNCSGTHKGATANITFCCCHLIAVVMVRCVVGAQGPAVSCKAISRA